jgi:hypothetical protein
MVVLHSTEVALIAHGPCAWFDREPVGDQLATVENLQGAIAAGQRYSLFRAVIKVRGDENQRRTRNK